jgi:hypothetical protein
MTVPRAWVLVGHYFRVLAIASLLGIIASLIRGKGLRLDFSFIFLFWIATGLMEGRKAPRIVAILIFAAFVATAIFSLGYTAFSTAPSNSMAWETLSSAMYLFLFLPPLTLLLRPSLVKSPDDDADPGKPGRPIGVYLIAALFVGTLPTALDLATVRISYGSTSGGFAYGENKMGVAITTTVEANPAVGSSKALFLSYWVIGESNSSRSFMGNSDHSSLWVEIENRTVIYPKVFPLRYVNGLESVREPLDQPNVFIVRADGRVIPLQRRVSNQSLPVADQAIRGCRDFDEIQRKLESLLPEVKGAFPSGLY